MKNTKTNTRRINQQSAIGRRINGRRDLNIANQFFANQATAIELASNYNITVGRVYQVLYDVTGGKSLA